MQTILHVIPSLDYSGAARQLTSIATGLPRDRFQVRVVILRHIAPWVKELRAATVEVDILGWKRPFEVAPFAALRRLLAERRPDVVHLWGRTAVRAVAAVGGIRGGRLFVSDALSPSRGKLWLDSWLLRRADVVMAFSEAEAYRCRRLGVRAERIAGVAPGVRRVPPPSAAAAEERPAGRLILGIGPIEPYKGFRDAVWALDVLHYLYDDLRLALAGDGSDRVRVEELARAMEVENRVAFLGRRPDLAQWLQSADLVWTPSRTGGGVCAALEAMAAGRPVIGTRLPELAEVIADGVTGCLVPPGDKTELARQTRFLLNDPDRRRAYGEAGRRRAAEQFSVEKLVRRCAALYEGGSAAKA